MFDNPAPQSPAQNTPAAGAPPVNLPLERPAAGRPEPEDILASFDEAQPKPAAASQRPPLGSSPPFSPVQGAPSEAEGARRGLAGNGPAPLPPRAPAVPLRAAAAPREPSEAREPFFKRNQRVIVLVAIVLVGGGVLAAGGWYGYRIFFVANRPQPALNQNAPAQPAANVANTNQALSNQNTNAGTNQSVNATPVVAPAAPADTDRDGVTDEEEALYGTDPAKVDTDDDTLTDRDEVKVFKTDPTNPDTDADGFTDGEEVRSGYDPKGEGRLLRIE